MDPTVIDTIKWLEKQGLPSKFQRAGELCSICSQPLNDASNYLSHYNNHHKAMRGGLMFSRNILSYLDQMNYIHIDHEDTIIDEIVGYAFAFLGVWFQLSLGFSIPFPLNIVLFPFTIMEYTLMWIVNTTH